MIFVEQKYYHFVVLKEKLNGGFTTLLKKIKELSTDPNPKVELEYSVPLKLIPFVTSENFTYEINYEEEKGDQIKNSDSYVYKREEYRPVSFCYDIWHYKINENGINALILLSPFAGLLKYIFKNIGEDEVDQLCSFYRADINKFIGLIAGDNLLDLKHLTTLGISNLEISFKGDDCLTSMKLTGRNPLNSQTYTQIKNAGYLTSAPDDNNHNKEDKTLKNNRLILNGQLLHKNATRMRAKIHVDKFGSFKVYIHAGFKNMSLIPVVFKELSQLNCVEEVNINPVIRPKSSKR